MRKDGTNKRRYTEDVQSRQSRKAKLERISRDITERKKAEEMLWTLMEEYRSVANLTGDIIVRMDADGRRAFVNDNACCFWGKPREELVGKKLGGYTHPEDREKTFQTIQEMIENRQKGEVVNRQRTPKGWRIVHWNGLPLFDKTGQYIGLQVTGRDLTEHKKAEEALRKSQKHAMFLADVLERSSQPLTVGFPDGRLVTYNTAYCKLLGYSKEELRKVNWFKDLTPPEWRQVVAKAAEKIRQTKKPQRFEKEYIRKDGSRVPVELLAHPIFDGKGNIRYFYSFVTDITERKKAEEALRESEEKYRTLYETIRDGIAGGPMDGRILECNQAFAEMLGYSKEELKNMTYQQLTPKSWHHMEAEIVKGLILKRGYSDEYEKEYIRKDGTVFPISARVWLIRDKDGKPQGMWGIVRDITERKKAEDKISQALAWQEAIFEGSRDAVFITDEDSRFVAVNRAACELTGYSRAELLRMRIPDLHEPQDLTAYNLYHDRIMAGEEIVSEAKILRKDGTKVDTEFNNRCIRISGNLYMHTVARDITERKTAEQQLRVHEAQLKSLASKLTLAEEHERRRIATELHDRISQSLVISKIKLDGLSHSISPEHPVKVLKEVCSLLGQAITDIRSLTFDLSCPILHELGFEAAVAAWLTDQIEQKHGIATELEDDGQTRPLDDDIGAILFRNVRELLINVVKHARASKVKVSIRRIGTQIRVSVEDDGAGFDPTEAASTAVGRAAFGLFSIRERLEELGGHLEIESEPGHGCKVVMTAPLKQGENTEMGG